MEASKCTSLSASLTFSALLAAAACSSAPEPQKADPAPKAKERADLVLVGGDIWTLDPDRPKATALAVRGEFIVAVGSDEEIRALVDSDTNVIELDGKSVSPGLIDSHAHLYGLGASLEAVQLRGVTSAEDAARRVADAMTDTREDEWITGRGWDQNLWSPAKFPDRELLDAAAPGRAVSLRRVDGHALWASSAALEKAGVTAKTPDPEGGKIIRDRRGRPTGVFIDNAMALIEDAIPDARPDAIRRRILRGAAEATSVGLTGVHEMGISPSVAQVYKALEAEGDLPLRVYAFLGGFAAASGLEPEGWTTPTDRFAMRSIKLFADGALGSRGARLGSDYSDDEGNVGLWLTEPDDLVAHILGGSGKGWQIGVHAIGDEANKVVLDSFALVDSTRRKALRHRVEHAQVLRPEDIKRFAELDVIASMQPTHATSDMPWAEDRVGSERIAGAYAWRQLLDAKARIAAGSDFPVEKTAPLLGVWAAVTRTNEAGSPEGGWRVSEAMTLEEALAAFTREGAYASFSEDVRGQLTVGRLADLTVYDSALTKAGLLSIGIEKTIVGGQIVFSK